EVSKLLILQTVDNLWMEHLDTMTDLREGISLRSMAQRDPLVEYKNEGARMFHNMLGSIDDGIVSRFYKVKLVQATDVKAQEVKVDIDGMGDNRPGEVSKQVTVKN